MLFLQIYIGIILFFLGACMGSFVTCAADRYIAKESVLKGRSHCPACGRTLGILDLIPIFSYLFLRGRCRKCGAPIPVRCLFTELVSALVYPLAFLRFGFSFVTLELLALYPALLAVALIDCDSMEIPDGLVLYGVLLFAALFYPLGNLHARAWDAVCGSLIFGGGILVFSLLLDFLLKKESLGGGDVKLFAMLGLYMGLARGLLLLVLSCIIGLLLSLFLRKGREKEFPFGPAIVLAAVFTLLFGEGIVNWYLSLFL